MACGISRPSESRLEKSQGLLIGWSLAWLARRSSAREEGFNMALWDLEFPPQPQLFLHCYLSSSLLERRILHQASHSHPVFPVISPCPLPRGRRGRSQGADGSVITIYVLHIAAHITSREGVFLPRFRS